MKAVGIVAVPFARHVIDVHVTGLDVQKQRVGSAFFAVYHIIKGVLESIISRYRQGRHVEVIVVVAHAFANGVIINLILQGGGVMCEGDGLCDLASCDSTDDASGTCVSLNGTGRCWCGTTVAPCVAFEPFHCADGDLVPVTARK